jgi:hypothetical protein
MFKAFSKAAMGAAMFMTAGIAGAAQGAETPVPADKACELHIWPSSGLRSVYYGWFHAGIVDGAINGRQGYPPVPKDPLPSALQIELMEKFGVPTALGMPAYKPVWHAEALDNRAIRSTASRLTDSTAACYAELIGDDVFFQQDVFSGSYLKSLIRFREFGPGPLPTRTFATWTQTKLASFPPKEDSQNEAALKELRYAFTNNINAFGGFLNKPQKKKR